MRQGDLILAAARVRSKEKKRRKKQEIPPHPKHTRLKMQLLGSGKPRAVSRHDLSRRLVVSRTNSQS